MTVELNGGTVGMERLPSIKGMFPFPVGAPSSVFPADIVPNVELLSDCVDYIELSLFESDAISPLPDAETVRRLSRLAGEKALSYTVHLPFDRDPGSLVETERGESVQACLRAVHSVSELAPLAFVLHWPAPADREDTETRVRWRESLMRSAAELVDAGLDTRSLCIETLDYPFEWVDDIIRAHGFSVCLDVGHILLWGPPIREVIERYFERVRVVHLHGVENGKDHCSISALAPDVLSLLLSRFRADHESGRVLTIEVFSEERLRDSLQVLAGRAEYAG